MVAIMYLYFLHPSRKGPRKFLIWREIEQGLLGEQALRLMPYNLTSYYSILMLPTRVPVRLWEKRQRVSIAQLRVIAGVKIVPSEAGTVS